MNTTHLVSGDARLVITPISKSYKSQGPCARRDWDEQLVRTTEGKQMMWDDSKHNTSGVGDILMAWHHNEGVTCHLITSVKHPSDRLASWSGNVGHSDRNVIEIDSAFATIPWHLWLAIGGNIRCMGTSNITTARDSIISILRASYYDSDSR